VAIAKMVRTEIAESMANGTCHRVICLCIQKDACQVVPALAYGRIFPWYWCFVYRRGTMNQWFGSFMIRGLCAKNTLAQRNNESVGDSTSNAS
jgi:hypothetical protein